jgi:hypothetical protein
MTNTPISASAEQKPASPANPQQTQGNPQQGNQQQTQGNPQQNQGGNKPSTDKPTSQPQQK